MFGKSFDTKFKIAAPMVGALLAVGAGSTLYLIHPLQADVGYAPKQPIAFSHKLHAGEMRLECQYCHTGVEKSAHSNVPATSTCMNCHQLVKTQSPEIKKVQQSWTEKKPIQWVNVHFLPEYVYFNHSQHVNAGVDCASCHGKIAEMEVVRQVSPLTMGWCLDCHRNPAEHVVPLREPGSSMTDLHTISELRAMAMAESTPATAAAAAGTGLVAQARAEQLPHSLGELSKFASLGINKLSIPTASQDCNTCHR